MSGGAECVGELAGLSDERRPRTVRVVQIQWWERKRAWLVAIPGRGPTRLDDAEGDEQ